MTNCGLYFRLLIIHVIRNIHCHVGIHWIAFADYSQISTHVPGFQSIFRFFASFCIGLVRHQQHKG